MQPIIAPSPAGLPAQAASLRHAAGDRRVHERVPLRRGGILELAGRRIAVNLLDLSAGGVALFDTGIDAVPGTAGALILDTALLPVTVAAVSDGRLHLAFQALSPAADSVLRRLLGGPPDRIPPG
ncbi:PilZ domain-containing protein [Roseomonas sp. CAU 1739]|uniref:PilZ domain-containing protein n=1 Tax=Roseomonas sp. CAU 1739 TaxID=3140364 RepID=UPI00325C05DD